MEFRFAYYNCQTCKERVNCDTCTKALTEELLLVPDIAHVDIQMAANHMAIIADLDPDDLESVLEEHGVFVQ